MSIKRNEALSLITLAVAAMIGSSASAMEGGTVHGQYTATLHGARSGMQAEYDAARTELAFAEQRVADTHGSHLEADALAYLRAAQANLEGTREVLYTETFDNLVTTLGKNYLLDNGMSGAAYTAAFYMGLVSSVSYSTIVAADTQASHAGWLEGGGANAPTYSGTRKTCAWAAASAGAKALSSGLVFTFTGAGTVKGCFLGTNNAVDGTTGTLFSAGLFSGGDQPVVSTNTLTVSYSLSL